MGLLRACRWIWFAKQPAGATADFELAAGEPRRAGFKSQPCRQRRKDGGAFWAELAVHEVPSGSSRSSLLMVQDVSDRVEAKQALERTLQDLEERILLRTKELKSSESRWRALVEATPLLVWAANSEGCFTFLSQLVGVHREAVRAAHG